MEILAAKVLSRFLVDISQAISIMSQSNNRGGGRIRVTDDSAVTIGAEVQVRDEHVAEMNATKTRESASETRSRNECNKD